MKFKREYCEVIARRLLDGFRVKDPVLEKRLADHIEKTKRVPDIRVFWNRATENVDFEIL